MPIAVMRAEVMMMIARKSCALRAADTLQGARETAVVRRGGWRSKRGA
jgi:hypothetical protein